MVRRLFALLAVLGVVAASAVLAGPVASQAPGPDEAGVRPMIFVHGFFGSGQQFEAQALRFTSNGYPASDIEVFEHDSLAWPGSRDEVWGRMDRLVDELLAASGQDQLYLLGHSQGTGVVQGYLNSDPARAAKVAAYVNLDGGPGGTVPASVRTLAVWGEGDPGRQIPGATNVQFADQSHTEVVNSPETFATIYEFLLGRAPQYGEVVREPADQITVSGRALLFPENAGAGGTTLDIYEVDGQSGLRLDQEPEATFPLATDGRWGPFAADGDAFYEFAIIRTGFPTHHVFLQRFVRSSRWVRILTSEPDGLANSFWEPSDTAQNVAVLRNTEWWGDQGAASDELTINGQQVLNAATSPRSNRTIGIFVHDAGLDGRSDLTEPVSPTGIPFLTGVDLVIPAGDPPPGTTSVVAAPRRGQGPEAVCIPSYSSTGHRSSVQFNSYHRLLGPDGSPAAGPANPTCAAAAPPPPPPPPTPPAAPPSGRPAQPARPVTAAARFTG